MNLDKLDSFLREIIKDKLPPIPEELKTKLVVSLPVIVLILTLLDLATVLNFIGFRSFLPPYFSYSLRILGGSKYFLIFFVFLVTQILRLLALPKLNRKEKDGWNLLAFSVAGTVVYNLLNFDLIGSFFFGGFFLYFLYQIESFYY